MRPLGVADLLAALVTLTDLDQEILRLVGWEELTVEAALRVRNGTWKSRRERRRPTPIHLPANRPATAGDDEAAADADAVHHPLEQLGTRTRPVRLDADQLRLAPSRAGFGGVELVDCSNSSLVEERRAEELVAARRQSATSPETWYGMPQIDKLG
jgi:hypothetical protein